MLTTPTAKPKTTTLLTLGLMFVMTIGFVAPIAAQVSRVDATEDQELVPSNNARDDQFGDSAAIDGDTLVIGTRLTDDGGADSGAAYVFVRTGTVWREQAMLVASDGAQGDEFGESVSISGDTIVIGGPLDDSDETNSGSAYVFVRSGTTWTEQAKLIASDAEASDNFGRSVAIDGDTIAVSSPNNDDGATNAGSAYVFERSETTWTERAKLTSTEVDNFDNFGWSVAVDRNTVAIGSFRGAGSIAKSGAVHVFVRSDQAWEQQAQLSASDAAAFDSFGWSIDIDRDTIAIGAPTDDDDANDSGSAYVFERSGTTWIEQAKLTVSEPDRFDEFGHAVAIDQGTVVGGARFGEDTESNSGAAYVFAGRGSESARCNGLDVTVDIGAGDRPTDGPDVILGTDGDDVINAGDGRDVICAGDGDDVINAGQGRDTVLAGPGDDFVSGGRGKDTIFGGDGNDDLLGNEGTDTIFGGDGNDEIRGGQKADLIIGGTGDDNLVGGLQPDVLDGGIGLDAIDGGGGDDTCYDDPMGLIETTTSCEIQGPSS